LWFGSVFGLDVTLGGGSFSFPAWVRFPGLLFPFEIRIFRVFFSFFFFAGCPTLYGTPDSIGPLPPPTDAFFFLLRFLENSFGVTSLGLAFVYHTSGLAPKIRPTNLSPPFKLTFFFHAPFSPFLSGSPFEHLFHRSPLLGL